MHFLWVSARESATKIVIADQACDASNAPGRRQFQAAKAQAFLARTTATNPKFDNYCTWFYFEVER
jgi:hypothetical protein